MNIEQLWEDTINLAKRSNSITTLKGHASAEIQKVHDNGIVLVLDKGISITLEKGHFAKALNELNEKGRVRQGFIKLPRVERYILGIMRMLPSFERVEQLDEKVGKYKKFIVYK